MANSIGGIATAATVGDRTHCAWPEMLGEIADPTVKGDIDKGVQAWLQANPSDASRDGTSGDSNAWDMFNHHGASADYTSVNMQKWY